MKFECLNPDCKKQFVYPAVQSSYSAPEHIANEPYQSVTTETHVCPYCLSKDLTEITVTDSKIVSVISVDLADVDAKLKEGYEVHELYAKTATLVKKQGVSS